MAKPNPIIKNDFSAGEVSPRLYGRVDIEDFSRGLKTCENWIPFIQGALQTRPGTQYVADVETSTERSRLIPFKFGTTAAYALEFGNLFFRVYYNNAGTYQRLGTVEVTTPYTTAQLQDIHFIQSNDILYLAHPSHAPRKVIRAADDNWGIAALNFIPPPTQEIKETSSTTLTLSAATGTGITVTAGAATFLGTPDIGKVITAGIGRLVITGYTSTTVVTADVIDDFDTTSYAAGDWYIKGTPNIDITPSASTPVGATITLTASAAAFRNGGDSLPTDIGKYVYVHDGVVQITAFTSSTVVSAKIIRVLSATTATFAWTMEQPIWNSTDGYPSTVTFHQDRLIWGGSTGFPQTIAASVVGDYENHERGTNDADAFLVTLNAREVNSIEWLVSRQDLIVGTTEAEWAIQSSTGVLTPSDIAARLQTAYGSKNLRPTIIDGSVLFFQKEARKLRELTFDFNVDGYTAPEMSLISEHITEGGIEEVSYQQSPMSILWMVRSDGQLIGFTFDKRAGAIAWHRHVPGGVFSVGDPVVESVASIPHPTKDYDELWMIVKRTLLDSAGDVSTATYDSKSKDVSAQINVPNGLAFSPDGLNMYISDGINPDAVFQYILNTPWDMSTAVYANKVAIVGTQTTNTRGVDFSADGLTMYIAGSTAIFQYALSTAWDVSTATYSNKSFTTGSNDVSVSADGASMYVLQSLTLTQFTLSTPGDVSTAVAAGKTADLSGEITASGLNSLYFNTAGTIFYIGNNADTTIYQYNLTTAGDLSTASYASKSKDVSAQVTSLLAIAFKPDGSNLYVVDDSAPRTVHQYTVGVVPVRFIEVLTQIVDDPDADPEDYWQLDSGQVFTGDATTTITGLSAWEGDTLAVVNRINGGYLGQFEVSGGEIDLGTTEVTNALTGYLFNSDMEILQTAVNAAALGQGQRHRFSQANVQFYKSQAGKIGPTLDDL
jgi:sugar lactone lactonase YvrE